MAAHTGIEPVLSALRGQRVNQLHQCAAKSLKGVYVAPDYVGKRGSYSYLLSVRYSKCLRCNSTRRAFHPCKLKCYNIRFVLQENF